MPALLPGDERTVEYEGVRITAPGLTGTVEVHRGGSAGARGAVDPIAELDDLLAEASMRERLTVVLRDQQEAPPSASVPGQRSTVRGEPALQLDVATAGEGWGELLLAVAEDGVVTWHLPDTPRARTAAGTDRGSSRTTFTLPRSVAEVPPTSQSSHRGMFASLGRRVLKVIAYRVAEKVFEVAADKAVGHWEARNRPHRLRLLTPGTQGDPAATDLDAEGIRRTIGQAGDRVLLFVHGTASTTHNGFHRLPDDLLAHLHTVYDGRVMAFDHPTLSAGPEDNVRWLGRQLTTHLPPDRRVDFDVVTHSRGGLVARVLAARPDLAGLPRERVQVHRIVFGATPNAGTPLADPQHLRDYIDTWSNILEFIPDNPVTSTLEVLLELLKHLGAGVIGGLAGLQAMDPNGEWLGETVNRTTATASSPSPTPIYHAISAEYEPGEGDGLGRFVRDRLTDHVFKAEANDLVVPTAGVHATNGAAGFPIGSRDALIDIDAARGLDHSSLWDTPEVTDGLARWLTS